ncbi:MAG: NUDIX hydrolase [Arachnia sp.]
MTGVFDQLRGGLAGEVPPLEGPRRPHGGRQAAVLLLFTTNADPSLTFIERASTLRSHAGQIAFPGGGLEPVDDSLVAAALREAHEEIGLDPAAVSVLGSLPPAWVPVSRYDVTPVVGTWDGASRVWARDAGEVNRVLSAPVSHLADPANRVSTHLERGYVGPGFVVGDMFIWGLSAILVDWVLRLAGWSRAWDRDRIVEVPARFRRD